MDLLRLASLILCIVGIVVYIVVGACHKRARLYLIAPFTWLGFILAFLVGSYGNQFGLWNIQPATLNAWSAATRLYSLIVIVGVGVIWAISPGGDIPDVIK